MRFASLVVAVVAGIALGDAGCSGSNSSSCANLAGMWATTGCSTVTCTVSQNVCTVQISCGLLSYSGTVTGESLDFTAFAADGGVAENCHGSLSGTTLNGTCASGATSCTFMAAKQ